MPLDEVERGRLIGQLKDFHDNGILQYSWYVGLILEGKLTNKQWHEFQTLRLDLLRLYGGLEEVIKEYGGPAVVDVSGRSRDAFNFALSSRQPTKGTLVAIDGAIAVLNKAIGKLEKEPPSKQLSSEAIYPSGMTYDAYKRIKEKICEDTKELTIVDPYVDSTLFDLLENVQSGVNIKILTQTMKGDFKLTGCKFKEQREQANYGKLEIRTSEKFHDRFIVADSKFFHIGASIKDIGTKLCAISEFEEQDIKAVLSETISRYWNESKVIL
jgi:hypothetical protein